MSSPKPLGETFDAGALHGTVAFTPTPVKDIRGMVARLAPVPQQSAMNLLRYAPKSSGQFFRENRSAEDDSGLHEEKIGITLTPTVSKNTQQGTIVQAILARQ